MNESADDQEWLAVARDGPSEIREMAQLLSGEGVTPRVLPVPGG